MTEPKTPPVAEIVELVDVTRWGYVALALAAGIVAGVAIVYLFVDFSEDKSNA